MSCNKRFQFSSADQLRKRSDKGHRMPRFRRHRHASDVFLHLSPYLRSSHIYHRRRTRLRSIARMNPPPVSLEAIFPLDTIALAAR
jgi:hypothetical protein